MFLMTSLQEEQTQIEKRAIIFLIKSLFITNLNFICDEFHYYRLTVPTYLPTVPTYLLTYLPSRQPICLRILFFIVAYLEQQHSKRSSQQLSTQYIEWTPLQSARSHGGRGYLHHRSCNRPMHFCRSKGRCNSHIT